jgi:hypothetical protein
MDPNVQQEPQPQLQPIDSTPELNSTPSNPQPQNNDPDPGTEGTVLELNFNEPDSPSNIEYDPTDPSKIKTCSFAKLIEKLTSPKKDGTSFRRFCLVG